MQFRRAARLSVLPLLLAVACSVTAQQEHRGRKYKAPPPTMQIDVVVVRASSGKPIPNAAVIFHPVNADGRESGDMELKTDPEGRTSLNVVPIGSTVRLQIIANGFQTFGHDYTANADAKQITIRMEKPHDQYSIYKHNGTADQGAQSRENQESTPEPAPESHP